MLLLASSAASTYYNQLEEMGQTQFQPSWVKKGIHTWHHAVHCYLHAVNSGVLSFSCAAPCLTTQNWSIFSNCAKKKVMGIIK